MDKLAGDYFHCVYLERLVKGKPPLSVAYCEACDLTCNILSSLIAIGV